MLDLAQGPPSQHKSCQATNLLRALKQVPEAAALGLLEPTDVMLPRRSQSFMRFLLQQLNSELAAVDGRASRDGASSSKSAIDRMLGSLQQTTTVCDASEHVGKRCALSLVLDMSYSAKKQSFQTVLTNSLRSSMRTRAWCNGCSAYARMQQTKHIVRPADLLMMNCNAVDEEAASAWRSAADWLPTRFWLLVRGGDEGSVRVFASKEEAAACGEGVIEYQLASVVSHVSGGEGEGHLVVHVREKLQRVAAEGFEEDLRISSREQRKRKRKRRKRRRRAAREDGSAAAAGDDGAPAADAEAEAEVAASVDKEDDDEEADASASPASPASPTSAEASKEDDEDEEEEESKDAAASDPWWLFSDFRISPSAVEDAVDFSRPWRTPCLLCYSRTNMRPQRVAAPAPISEGVWTAPPLSPGSPFKSPTFTRLRPSELPGRGDHVAIDCEFVSLCAEEADVLADGRRVVTKESRLSLGRVSVLRSDGLPFIDDYITTSEPVVDYLTRFSGLVPGDLNPSTSPHYVVSLKTAYLKLRHLVDRGCIFVGHGLAKDFRILNVYVPPEQIVDTVNLFYLDNQRRISLRFLAFHALDVDIQGETHDSIEDARTALLLYRRYLELVKAGEFDRFLHGLYDKGRSTGWKLVGPSARSDK
eukprot:PLAT6041.1.p1 GENE.PLAT6041.1~~PLAT6041.1.p1  ORF type:complete len:647 (+),score=296.72 PLAT6041.1:749-2689(+)